MKRNGILYAQVDGEGIQQLHTQITALLELEVQRRFLAHVTLMRVKKISDETSFREKVRRCQHRLLGEVNGVMELWQSRLDPEGAHYTTLKSFPWS